MKIKLLFTPRCHCDRNTGKRSGNPPFPPLGMATLTGFLRQHNFSIEQDDLDIKVQRCNLTTDPEKKINLNIFMDKKKIKQLIEEKHSPELEQEAKRILKLTAIQGKDIIGFSLDADENLSTASIAMALGKIIKEEYGSTILVGGPIIGDTIETLLKSGFIDYIFLRSPVYSVNEIDLLNFCKSYEKGAVKNIPSVMYLKNGRLVRNFNIREYSKTKKFIFTRPDFDGLPMDLYRQEVSREVEGQILSSKILFLPYFFVRGCPHKCTFCYYSTESCSFKNPNMVAIDLKKLSKKYKTKFFYFLNTSINPTYQYAEKIADEIIKNDLNIFWTDCVHFSNIDEKLIKKLKDSGGIRFVFGAESGSPKMLSYLKKSFILSTAEKIIKKSHKMNIGIQIDVICGFPYETDSDIKRTVNFIKRNRRHIDWVNVYKFYISGQFHKRPEEYGIRIREDNNRLRTSWSTMAFDEVHGLSWEEKVKQTNLAYNRIMRVVTQEHKEPIVPSLLFFSKMYPEIKEVGS